MNKIIRRGKSEYHRNEIPEQKQITSNWQEEEEPTVINNLIQEEVYRQLLASIDHLPPQCRKICLLTLEGKKPSEIAKQLDLAVDTVKKQKQIALKRLQDELGTLTTCSLFLHLWLS